MDRRDFIRKAGIGGTSAGIISLAGCSAFQRPENIAIDLSTPDFRFQTTISVAVWFPEEEDDIEINSRVNGDLGVIFTTEPSEYNAEYIEKMPSPASGISVVVSKVNANYEGLRLEVSTSSGIVGVKRTNEPYGKVEITKEF